MRTTTMQDLRANMKAQFDQIQDNHDILIVPRNGNDESIVMMTLSEYNSLKETNYLLSNKANRDMLINSMKELDSGNTVEFQDN